MLPKQNILLSGGPPRVQLERLLRHDNATVAWYQPPTADQIGASDLLNCSAWKNWGYASAGSAGNLLQATGANQPIIVSSDYVPKLYLPAVAGNTVTSPNKTVAGNQVITLHLALDDYTPAADVTLVDKTSGNDGFAIKWLTTDKLRLVIGDGAGLTNFDASTASGLVDGTRHTIVATYVDNATLDLTIDGAAWGTQVVVNKVLTNAAVDITVGSTTSACKVYSIAVGSVYSMNAADSPETSTNGATFVSSATGETWTLNITGAKPAMFCRSPMMLFDGANHNLLTAGALLPGLPLTLYAVITPITVTNFRVLLDAGAVPAGTSLQYFNGTPTMGANSTGGGSASAAAVLNQKSVMTCTFSATSTTIKIDGNAVVTGAAAVDAASGLFSVGSQNNGNGKSNFLCHEALLVSAVDAQSKRNRIQSLLRQIHSTP